MKFIWYYEFDPADAEKVSAKNKELDTKMKKHPEKYPRLQSSYMTGRCKGLRIIDADNEEQLVHLVMQFYPEEKWELVPILKGSTVSSVFKAPGFKE